MNSNEKVKWMIFRFIAFMAGYTIGNIMEVIKNAVL